MAQSNIFTDRLLIPNQTSNFNLYSITLYAKSFIGSSQHLLFARLSFNFNPFELLMHARQWLWSPSRMQELSSFHLVDPNSGVLWWVWYGCYKQWEILIIMKRCIYHFCMSFRKECCFNDFCSVTSFFLSFRLFSL